MSQGSQMSKGGMVYACAEEPGFTHVYRRQGSHMCTGGRVHTCTRWSRTNKDEKQMFGKVEEGSTNDLKFVSKMI